MENYYSVLGVTSSASEEEIKKAYRKLSIKMHPDKNEGDQFFEEFFKKINEAYFVLGNRQRRKEYDAFFGAKKSEKEPVKKPEKEPVKKAENVNRKSDFVVDYSQFWKEVKTWRRIKNSLLVLNVCILLIAIAPHLGLEIPFEKKSENIVLYGKTRTVNSLNLRILPSLDADVVTRIPPNARVEILEESKSSLVIDGKYANWLRIKYGADIGWVWGGYVELFKDEELTVRDKSEIKLKNRTAENILFQRNDYSHEEELDLNESDFVDVEESSVKKKSGMSSNPFGANGNNSNGVFGSGNGDGTGIETGREDNGMSRDNRIRLNDVNLDDLVIEEDAIVVFRLSVNSEGEVENAVKDSDRTTTSNSWLISVIRKRVIAQVRYSKSNGRGLEMFYYSVKVSAD